MTEISLHVTVSNRSHSLTHSTLQGFIAHTCMSRELSLEHMAPCKRKATRKQCANKRYFVVSPKLQFSQSDSKIELQIVYYSK